MGITSSVRRDFLKTFAASTGVMTLGSVFSSSALGANERIISNVGGKQTVNTKSLVSLLQELIYARGPCGYEDEVREICEREMKKYCDKIWVDEAENIVGLIRGRSKTKKNSVDAPIIRVMAHMDENAMMVKRINSDGTLRVKNLGGIHPGVLGQGPVEIMADSGILPGVLSVGPLHTSAETSKVEAIRTEAMTWSHVHIFTRKSAEELKKAGVHAGTRVVIARERRKLFEIDDCIGGYYMDNRAPVVIALCAAALLKASKEPPPNDVYIVMTAQEEIGAIGAMYASRTLPGDLTLAVDVGPATDEYKPELTPEPIVAYGDAVGVYTRSVADRLLTLAKELGMEPQTAVWERYGSDASIPKRSGQAGRAGLICIATENTHGYEIIPRDGLQKCGELLEAYLKEPV